MACCAFAFLIYARNFILTTVMSKSYEVIGTPPNVGVPTHFAKVVLAARPVSPSNPSIAEISAGAFVLPNAQIPDEASLESFAVPSTWPSRFTHSSQTRSIFL